MARHNGKLYDSLEEHYRIAIEESDRYFAEERKKQAEEKKKQAEEELRIKTERDRRRKQILGVFELPIAVIKLICVPFIAMFMLPIAIYKWWCENNTVRYVVYTILIVIVIAFVLSLPIGLLHLLAYLDGYTN